ncbi:MAG TPA: GNVR domain-containing protein [Vicinamibacterales bacterium]|nr:GNVR domain-containing protein [Vicinamibacterales bacterium]
MIPGKTYTPEDLLALVWRRRWVLVFAVVLGAASGLAVGRLLPNRYESETMIMVVPQRVPETYVRSTVTTRIEDRLKTIYEQILSRVRLERIVHEFNLYPALRAKLPLDDVIDHMRTDIDVRLVGSDSFRVAYTSDDAVVAQKVTARLASLFIEENLKDREVAADATSQFLDTQLDSARRRLEDQERKLAEYNRAHNGELPSQLASNQQMLQNTQLQLQALQDSLNRDRDRRLTLDGELAELTAAAPSGGAHAPVPAAAAPSGPDIQTQLQQARASLQELSARYTDAHPDVRRARELVSALERQAAEAAAADDGHAAADATASTTVATTRANRIRDLKEQLDLTERQIATKQNDERRLRDSMDELRRRVDATPLRESELASLTRDYDTVSHLYTSLLSKKEDSTIAANLERKQIGEQFRVLDPARVPDRPVTPNRRRLTAEGAGAGLVLALALIALAEYRNLGLRDEEEVAASTGLAVVAVIPMMVPFDPAGRAPGLKRLLGPRPTEAARVAANGR